MRAERGRRIEPWPVAVALLLAAMIAVCLVFWAIAAAHPDPRIGDPWAGADTSATAASSPRAQATRP